MEFDPFTTCYIQAILFTESDENDEPLERNYDVEDFGLGTIVEIMADCKRFQELAGDDIVEDLEQAGIDFWLTRNRHGAGFWDGDWEKKTGQRLTKLSHDFGEKWCCIGDDGKVHVH